MTRLRGTSSNVRAAATLVIAAAMLTLPGTLIGQERADTLTVELAPDTIGLGDPFDLVVTLPVAGDEAVFFPDTLRTGAYVESFRPVQVSVEAAADGQEYATLRYPMVGFRVGGFGTPPFRVLTGRVPEGSPLADGAVGSWSQLESTPEIAATLTVHDVPPKSVWIGSVLTVETVAEGFVPRPADDVVGASWNALALILILAFGGLLIGVVALTGRDAWLAHKAAEAARAWANRNLLEEARLAALAKLEQLRASGLHEKEVEAFYEGSSSAVRSYVEHIEEVWGPAHTSTELMGALREKEPARDDAPAYQEMGTAEVVKFGRSRPGPETAESHLTTLKGWLDGRAPEAEGAHGTDEVAPS